jgi:hypothetical protein
VIYVIIIAILIGIAAALLFGGDPKDGINP